jgi:hypothetical protein
MYSSWISFSVFFSLASSAKKLGVGRALLTNNIGFSDASIFDEFGRFDCFCPIIQVTVCSKSFNYLS